MDESDLKGELSDEELEGQSVLKEKLELMHQGA